MLFKSLWLTLLLSSLLGSCSAFHHEDKDEIQPKKNNKNAKEMPESEFINDDNSNSSESLSLKQAQLWARVDELETSVYKLQQSIQILEKGLMLGAIPEKLKSMQIPNKSEINTPKKPEKKATHLPQKPKTKNQEVLSNKTEPKKTEETKKTEEIEKTTTTPTPESKSPDDSRLVPPNDVKDAEKALDTAPDKKKGNEPAPEEEEDQESLPAESPGQSNQQSALDLNYSSRLKYANQLYGKKNYAKACLEYSKLEQEFPQSHTNGETLYFLGECWLHLKEFTTAENILKVFVKKFPKSPLHSKGVLSLAKIETLKK